MKSDTLVIILFLAAGGTIMYLLLKKPTTTLAIPGGTGVAAGYNPGNTAVTTLFAGLGATIGGALRNAFSSTPSNTSNSSGPVSKEASIFGSDSGNQDTAALGIGNEYAGLTASQADAAIARDMAAAGIPQGGNTSISATEWNSLMPTTSAAVSSP